MRLEARDHVKSLNYQITKCSNLKGDHFVQIYFTGAGTSPEASDVPRAMKVAVTKPSWVAGSQLLNAVL